MSSSRKTVAKILGMVTPAVAEDFLVRLGNLRDEHGEAEKLASKFPEMLHPSTTELQIRSYQRELRRAWDSPDRRNRDWYIFALRRAHALLERSFAGKENPLNTLEEALQTPPSMRAHLVDGLIAPPPQMTPFEAALYYFQTRIADFAKHCAHVDCPAPYFIAAKRKQKFCSEKCAGPANRESKRKWWHENHGREVSR